MILPYLIYPVGESIIGSRGCTEDFPVIYYEFMATRGSLSFWDPLKHASCLNCRLQVQCDGIVCLSLQNTGITIRPLLAPT